ncbi:MAG: hypothetical protein HY066_08730 [Betaproteobacteria bacterium]|nr:hypothetical protein [Betaproteobacteria bacterium]
MNSKIFQCFAVILLSASLTSCGGGGGAAASLIAEVGTGGTGLTIGTITGFGSVIIDGARYPDTAASYDVTGDSKDATPVSRVRVKIGQQAEVETDAGGNATAVHIYPEVIGVVSAVSAPSNSFTVAGTRVVVNAADPTLPVTVYGGYTQFSSIQPNDRVEVHGLPKTDSAGPYVAATRIELKPSICPGGCAVRVTGILSQLTATGFTLGGANGLNVSYAGGTVISPAGQSLANGERVSVFSSTPVVDASLAASAIKIRKLNTTAGNVRLSGAISNYTSSASFTLAGVTVNAAAAALSPATLKLSNGLNVIASGSFDPAANQLVATSVSGYSRDQIQAELHGTITNYVSASNFRVRGVLVDASMASFSAGSQANLQNNAYVEIHGAVLNNIVKASTVSFQDETSGSVDDLSGVVGGYSSPTQAFTITPDNRRLPVQVTLAATPFFVGGASTDLSNGKYVTVNATLVNGSWVVNTVTFMLGSQSNDNGDGSGGMPGSKEIEGIASNVDMSAGTFSLNGITVKFDKARITGGATLANGVQVQVYGMLSGSILTASRIEID